MKAVKLINTFYTKAEVDEIVPMYSLSEIEFMDNVSEQELKKYKSCLDAVGFVEKEDSEDDRKIFIQVYEWEIEESYIPERRNK